MSKISPHTELIIGNSNKRFSGVTSTMLQVLPHQEKLMQVAVLGNHHLPHSSPCLTFRQMINLCKTPLTDNSPRIFHARRNDEMIQALVAKSLLGDKLKIVFTSTAQRHHSKFTRWLMSKMDAIITTCNAANSYLKQPADIIIPHGIDLEHYTPKKELQTPIDTLNVSVFGRVRPSKGIDLLIDAIIPVFKSNPNVSLTICGETTPKYRPFLEEQKKKISDAGLAKQVDFTGKVPFSELSTFYQRADIVCAVSRNEGFGLTPLEAMASGTAVLTSEAGAWKDIVSNGVNGYCVATNDVGAIREKLELMIQSREKLIEMGKAGRKLVEEKYTNKIEAERLCAFFKKLQAT